MKRYLQSYIVTFLLITSLIFLGCGTKETQPIQSTDDKPQVQIPSENAVSRSQEIETGERSQSSEAELGDRRDSPEVRLKDQPRRSPEAEQGDRPRSPEAELDDRRDSPEARLKDQPRRAPEAEQRDRPRSPEAELDGKRDSPEARLEDQPRRSPEIARIAIPENSVLRLIPETTLGLIYCPSLLELDDRINSAAFELVPQAGPSTEILAEILADSFGAGFERLEELEDHGLDLEQDFTVFFTSIDPMILSACIHLTDTEAMLQVIDAEAEGSTPTQYQGETYWSTPEGTGNFAIIDNILVFSQVAEVCENVIDVAKDMKPSISKNATYSIFLENMMKGEDQVSAIFNLKSIVAPLSEGLTNELESIIDSMQSDPASMSSVPLVEGIFTMLLDTVEELESISLSLQIDGTDVQLSPFLKFADGGKIHQVLDTMKPNQLISMNDLPNEGFMFGGFEGNAKALYEWGMKWIQFFPDEILDDKKLYEELMNQFIEVYDYLGDEWSFYVSVSESLIPDYLTIYEVKDEQKVRSYYDEHFLDSLSKMMGYFRESLEDVPELSMYDGAYIGNPVIHNGVEIKSFVFPNFGAALGEMEVEFTRMFPQEWHWSYAISEGRLYFAIGGPEPIKSALDSKGKIGESISEDISFQKLVGKLGDDNNMLFGLSPLNAVKGYVNLISRMDQSFAAELQMISGILTGIPENYSIGVSGKVHDGGVGAKLLITLGDFKQLINAFAMLSGMGQLQ